VAGAARYAVRAGGIEHDSPASVLAVLNDTLLLDADHSDARFCTIVYGRLRPHGATDFRLTVACGGHPLPLILRRTGRVETLGSVGSLVGLLGDVSFTDRSTRLRPGDAVVFFTDGVTEARVVGNAEFGSEGIEAVLPTCAGKSASEITRAIDEAATAEGARQRDDIAIMVVKVVETAPPT
jgi:sigma-B regulation protein RsbU (phosphoserine phosphatase)